MESLNLQELLEAHLASSDNLDLSFIRFVLRRMGDVRKADCVPMLLDNLDRLHFVVHEIVEYIGRVGLEIDTEGEMGKRLMTIWTLEPHSCLAATLPFNRMWLYHPLQYKIVDVSAPAIIHLLNAETDSVPKRELICALGGNNVQGWFSGMKQHYQNFDPWCRRAFIHSSKCLPKAEYDAWIRSAKRSFDPLDRIVASHTPHE